MSRNNESHKVPSSISRTQFDHFDLINGDGFSSILGKRKADWLTSEDAENHERPSGKKETVGVVAKRLSNSSSSSSSAASPVDGSSRVDREGKRRSDKDVAPSSPTARPKRVHDIRDHFTAAQRNTFTIRQIRRRHSLPSLASLQNENKASGSTSHCINIESKPPSLEQTRRSGFPVIYRISCFEGEKRSRAHESFLYEDDPLTSAFPDGRRSLHLKGNKPIYQLRDYVRCFEQSSFVILKHRTCKDQIEFTESWGERDERMLIVDDALKRTIHKVATCPLDNPDTGADSRALEMPAPYRFLHHHRKPLQTYSESAEPPLHNAIQAVLEYVDLNYGHEYAEAADLLSRGKITSYHLDKIFHPNQLIAVGSARDDRLKYLDIQVVKGWPDKYDNQYELLAWQWRFQTIKFGRSEHYHTLWCPVSDENEPFAIEKLFVRPASLLSRESTEVLRERGKHFWSLSQPTFAYYTDNDTTSHGRTTRPGRYMIDIDVHSKLHPEHRLPQTEQKNQLDPWRRNLGRYSEPTQDEFLIMPEEIPGYDLLEKEWVQLPVSNIKPITWNKQPFEDLVLSDDIKHLVKAMVTIRASSIKSKRKDQSLYAGFDIIPGKGNGLIMLFHGSPGTGKTLTAESVAEIAEMPLYPITCGDIGTDPENVEKYLRLVFMLGKRWNCVLLLDEADVFLEERTLTDLQRNSLVSVFLRMIEYYEGILILTSNRVGTFDEAFRSRINIALHYEDLKPRSRRQIWSNFLSRLEGTEEGENVDEIKERLDELAKHQLNGREIRNALSTARQLASHDGEKMSWEHLKLAIKTVNDFGSYLEKSHGHSNKEWVRETGIR